MHFYAGDPANNKSDPYMREKPIMQGAMRNAPKINTREHRNTTRNDK